jgi:prevent-host-death family protein
MRAVSISELKNNLSYYLRQVRQGEEITITDRDRVIARIVPDTQFADYDEELLELAAHGKVKLPDQPLDPNLWRKLKPAKLKNKGEKAEQVLKRIWEEERGDY